MLFGHIDTITKLFLPVISRSELDITIEEAKFANIIFKILIHITDSKERQLQLVENDLLDRVISFLKIVKKVEGANLLLYREKSNRQILRATRDEGYRFLEPYIRNFYDKDIKVTNYLCSRQTLDLIIDAASRCVINIANQIDPQEITINSQIYSSVLCTVHSGFWRHQMVAVKTFDVKELPWNITNFRKEVTMFTLVKHPNACPFYGYFIAPNYDNYTTEKIPLLERPLILMPFIKNGSLTDEIENRVQKLRNSNLYGKVQVIDTPTLANMAMNAANCIHFLHSRYIIHRDIKPANFLLDENFVLRVTDFGVSRAMEDELTGNYTWIGTEVYMAPEVYSKNYDYKADTYSFALVLWSMVTGQTPYTRYEKSPSFAATVASGIRPDFPIFNPPILPELKQLIESCWAPNPALRPDFGQIQEILYNMRCPHTNIAYTHIYDSLDPQKFRDIFLKVLSYLDHKSRTSLCLTNKKFHSLLNYLG